jgi:hypothetical protein
MGARTFDRGLVVTVLCSLFGCGSRASLPPARETPGRIIVVEPGVLPPDHPVVTAVDPASSDDHVGRAPRRLSVDQLRSALLLATGYTWVARRTVFDPDSPSGTTKAPDADMLDALAATLGRADYVTTTKESLDPAVTFAKLASDAARSACRASVRADFGDAKPADAPKLGPSHEKMILHDVGKADTFRGNPDGVRKNVATMAMRFWGRKLDPRDPSLKPLVTLFERASTAPAGRDASGATRALATPADGWRAVCIAMVTDPQFLTY